MGELPLFYAASDIAFVGGSLVPIGGHNLLEPASLGLPIVTGPHMFNAEDIADMFVAREASVTVGSGEELTAVLVSLFDDGEKCRAMGERARRLLSENRGALQRLYAEYSGCLLQAQHIQQVVVARPTVIRERREELLLSIEDVHGRPCPYLESGFGGLQSRPAG